MYKAKDKEKFIIAALILLIVLISGTIYLKSNAATEIILTESNSNNSNNSSTNVDALPSEAEPEAAANDTVEEKSIIVYICGQVGRPGNITIAEGSRLGDAIEQAGGALENADLNIINLAHILSDAEMVYVPKKGEIIDEKASIVSSVSSSSPTASKKSGKVNINTASESELDTLPGIGPSTAVKIIEHRNQNGKFKTINDLKNVTGIGAKKFDSLKDFITVQ